MSEAYHQSELQIARDASHPAHVSPPVPKSGNRVLDIGCGAGQTLLCAMPGRLAFGVDIDEEALRVARRWSDGALFVCARAEALPFRSGEFDEVWARVSLAYTNLPVSLREIRRVLKPGGLVWMVLHPAAIPWQAARAGGPKAWLFFLYIAVNSWWFAFAGRMFPLLGRYESFQTEAAMRRALYRSGFQAVTAGRERHFVITARAALE